MTEEINYKNNPLNGVGLKALITELVEHYGFEILHAYLNINCFKTNPSIASSIKFLKNTDWAREKVEAFYMYQYKNLPAVSSEQFHVPPRDRIVPDEQKPGEPAKLSLEDAEQLREKREKKAAEHGKGSDHRYSQNKSYGARRGQDSNRESNKRSNKRFSKSGRNSSDSSASSTEGSNDPWAKWRNKSED